MRACRRRFRIGNEIRQCGGIGRGGDASRLDVHEHGFRGDSFRGWGGRARDLEGWRGDDVRTVVVCGAAPAVRGQCPLDLVGNVADAWLR